MGIDSPTEGGLQSSALRPDGKLLNYVFGLQMLAEKEKGPRKEHVFNLEMASKLQVQF